MSALNFIRLEVKEIFDLSLTTNSSWFTKTFINENQGDVPVYSASKFESTVGYGYVQDNLEEVKYFNDCLTWNIDGSIGKAHYRQGKFTISEKVIPLVLNEKYSELLDYKYLKYVLESKVVEYGFGFSNKAGKGKISKIELDIPCDAYGKPDIKEQKKIALEKEKLSLVQNKLLMETVELKSSRLSLLDLLGETKVKKVQFGEPFFNFITEKTGWTKKKYFELDTKNENDCAVYTAARNPVAYVDLNSHPSKLILASNEKPIISFASNGDGSAGKNLILHKNDFYISNDRTAFSINNEFLNIHYIYYSLFGLKEQYGFNHSFKATPNNLKDVYIEIPVNNNNKFCLQTQSIVAQKFQQYENIKEALINQLEELTSSSLTFEFFD